MNDNRHRIRRWPAVTHRPVGASIGRADIYRHVEGTGLSQSYQRILPLITEENRFYWTSGAENVLRILQCTNCSEWVHPPRPVCSVCMGKDLVPTEVSGEGEVFSFTLNYKSWAPGLEVPYTIAVVQLDEQADLRLTTNLRGIAAEDVRIGQRVSVMFEQDEDVWLPMFHPTLGKPAAAI